MYGGHVRLFYTGPKGTVGLVCMHRATPSITEVTHKVSEKFLYSKESIRQF